MRFTLHAPNGSPAGFVLTHLFYYKMNPCAIFFSLFH